MADNRFETSMYKMMYHMLSTGTDLMLSSIIDSIAVCGKAMVLIDEHATDSKRRKDNAQKLR